MAKNRLAVQVHQRIFYLDLDGRIHEYRAQSRVYDPKTGESYLEFEEGKRVPLRDGLWGGLPGEFVPWRIRQWEREAREAARRFRGIPTNFVFQTV